MVLAPASHALITVDGDLSDWGVTLPNVPDAPPAAWVPSIGAHASQDGIISPGIGGQDYDIEAMYAAVLGDTLYFALVTGFDQGGEAGDIFLPRYDGGDIFFNFGGGAGYNVAVRITDALRIGSTGIGNVYQGDFSPVGDSYLNTEDVFIPMHQPTSNPWRVDDAAVGGLGVSLVGTTTIAYVQDDTVADHNVYEFALDLSALGISGATVAQGFNVHWTMECGNDVMDWSVPGDLVVIPEPAGMTLLGIGLLGIAIRYRRRSAV
jgi:hypothetical protein